MSARQSRVLWLLTAVLLAALTWGSVAERERLAPWLDSLRGSGPAGVALFVVVYAVTTVVGVPATFMTLAGGFAWGPVWGTLAVWPGAVLGALGAYALARTLLRDSVAARVAADPRLLAIDRAVGAEGGRLVLLLRLSPAVPFNALNFALGVTSLGWRDYTVATAIGIIPGCALYAWFGSTMSDVAAVLAGRPASSIGWGTTVVGGLTTVAATVLLTRASRRALAEHLSPDGGSR